MGDKEWDPGTVPALFGDETARQILVLASQRPLSAGRLAELCDVSRPTVYRRVNALLKYDFLDDDIQFDDEGNQYKAFRTTLERISFEIEDGDFRVDVQMRRSLVDQFESFWGDLESEATEVDVDVDVDVTEDDRPMSDDAGHGDPNYG
ncbi:MAG: winged helix-turn-helix domain-containing protein [Halobacteriaceae archaeon]